MRDALPTPGFPADFFANVDPGGPLEAAVIFKRNGKVLASWTKHASSVDVVTVMAATLLGSIDTLVETLGGPGGSSVTILTETRRMYLQRIEPSSAILLVAPAYVTDLALREAARRFLAQMPSQARPLRSPMPRTTP